jgi:hypothetical protein
LKIRMFTEVEQIKHFKRITLEQLYQAKDTVVT